MVYIECDGFAGDGEREHAKQIPLEATMIRWPVFGCAVFLTLCSAPLVAQEPNWLQKLPTNSPAAREDHAMAYDVVHGQVTLFGGFDGGYFNDTWVWNGINWTQKSPANSPTPRCWHRMVYDEARAQVVLFEAYTGHGSFLLTGTWVWDGTNWTQ
jgi:hypothetical protein